MHRRTFTFCLAAASLVAGTARAAGEPVEGKDYRALASPVPVAVPGKIEVIEFFGYWCPHCRALEPWLEAWAKKLPSDVLLRRVPVAWQPLHQPYQRLYYALESLGVPPAIHGKVFEAVHAQGQHLEVESGVAAFAAANGLDKTRLLEALKSFAVASKVRATDQLWKSYGLDGVPALVVNGRYITSPAQAGGDERTLVVLDALIRKARTTR